MAVRGEIFPNAYWLLNTIGNLLLTQTSLETFSKDLVFLLVKTPSKHVQMIHLFIYLFQAQ